MDADNRRKHTNNKGASMHDAFMLIGIRTTLTNHSSDQGSLHLSCSEVSKCFRSFHTLLNLSFCVYWDTNSLVVNAPNLFTFNLYEDSL